MKYQVSEKGYYGEFGGAYIPEILFKNVEELKNSYLKVTESKRFKKEFAAPDKIIIDDTESVINDWNDAGGIGILHKDWMTTLSILKMYV